jgi:hypothetical protein
MLQPRPKMAQPACGLALNVAHSWPNIAFCAPSTAMVQVRVDAGLGCTPTIWAQQLLFLILPIYTFSGGYK